MAEFTELHKTLARMRGNSCLYQIIGLFAENNTTYIVYDSIEAVTLVDYLKDNSGELIWEQVKRIFPPFFTSLNMVHNSNIFHRGISPETIYITKNGEIKLSSFGVTAVRTAGTGIQAELFKGYVSPEQYSLAAKQGAWTDVYSLCAVLYRVLTGVMPTDSQIRLEHDDLPSPYEVNPNIPLNVSRAIMEGMSLYCATRIQSTEKLITLLFSEETPSNNQNNQSSPSEIKQKTTVMKAIPDVQPIVRKPKPEPKAKEEDIEEVEVVYKSTLDRIKIPVIIGVLLLAILLVLAVILNQVLGKDQGPTTSGNGTSTSTVLSTLDPVYSSSTTPVTTVTTTVTTTTTTTDAVKNIQMYALVGRTYELLKSQPWWEDFQLLVENEYSDEYEKGQVTWQEVPAGEMIAKGQPIKIKVSLGPSKIPVPPLPIEGVTYEAYLVMLQEAGIATTMVIPEYQENPAYENGYVIGTDAVKFDLLKFDTNGTPLKIFVAKNPEVTTVTTVETTTTTTAKTTKTDAPDEPEEPMEPEEPATPGNEQRTRR
jgi:serine/threonine-protein kinase